MLEGISAWRESGRMVYASEAFIAGHHALILDLRAQEDAAQARIPGAVSIPFATLKEKIREIPPQAPVILYSDSPKTTARAFKLLRTNGLHKISAVPGGIQGWIRSGRPTESGPVNTSLYWQKQPARGEVLKQTFLRAVNGQEPGVIILDVRTREETRKGSFRKALKIPLTELHSRMKQLPKNKKIYIYCAHGPRAELAASELLSQGYQAYFLSATVDCQGNQCEIR